MNDVACHGIPNDTELKTGDVISVDISVFSGEAHGDSCRTYIIGQGSERDRALVQAARECLLAGINACKDGQRFSAIGASIEAAASNAGASVIRNITGHGIGRQLHAAPEILHYRNDDQSQMRTGMIFTIEPCVTMGPIAVRLDEVDGWTVRTVAGGNVAQFEHTVRVDDAGCEVLT